MTDRAVMTDYDGPYFIGVSRARAITSIKASAS
jgi:hypothetical protein